MSHLSYSFCMSMLHSLWQGGLMWLLFVIVDKALLRKSSPLEKRNLLFVLIAAQMVLFTITFFICFSDTQKIAGTGGVGEWVNTMLPQYKLYAITPWLFSIYSTIIAYKIIKAIYTWYHFRQQYQVGLQKPPVELKLFTSLKAHQFGIKRKINLWLSKNINTPVTFGHFKPVILLPLTLFNNIDAVQAETLILHELSHIKTNDYLLNWFLIFADTVFFFNPFITVFCNRIKLEREKYCDTSVMAFAYSPAVYAEALLKAERIKQVIPAFQLAAVSRKKHLLQRIRFFSRGELTRQPRTGNFLAQLACVAILICVFSVLLFRSSANGSVREIPVSDIRQVNDHNNGSIESTVMKYVNNILPVVDRSSINRIAADMKKQKPVLEKQLRKLQPMLRTVQREARKLSEQFNEENLLVPVTNTENDASREIIIDEETSGSKSSSVKVYHLSFENGQWVIQPGWMVVAKEIRKDSLVRFQDSVRKELRQQ